MQGLYLSAWYAEHGIQGGDRFVVRVTGLDCASVKETDLQGCGGAAERGFGEDCEWGCDGGEEDAG